MEKMLEEMTTAYKKSCQNWVDKATKSVKNKTKKYAKVVLPKYSGEPYTEAEFASIMGL